ncbi:DNA polymerase III subunit gamma/tau [Dictyobacter formicarum]|uniref:DNA polymerase III subunit gamma/tau n=1 Tax=Dictyobacter formicarum TaxID=2778368 RepID=A0ABQ3VJH3_9CHLR|nr:DNA polymerase III subunit gamma/tau [Dictyobacter formicarum]GHO86245.1 DNA polymerase III subunit gamma/tau [Dictyobacter formicarum]
MASQSLYRKWRSQTFGDLVGQEPVIRTLKNALSSGNLAHAYLFTGPRGTGKTSMARLLAKTINCLNPQNGEPCNQCEQCREITNGSSFNVSEIDAASNRGIDSIRELREKVMMPPATGKYKVYILDEAHMLTTEAFNALLKTLEEPPAHAVFVMATTDVHKMLPTVLSRCQRFDFKRFSLRQLVSRLHYVAQQEQVDLQAGAAELIARAAAGGMRDALSLLDQAIAYCGHVITLEQIQAMLGVADPQAIQKLILHVANMDSAAGLHLINELSEAGADLRQINTQVAEFWRAMMLSKAGANISEILDNTEDEIKDIQQAAQYFGLEELTECARAFAQNELMQKGQGTPQLGLELAFLACVELHRRAQDGTGLSAAAAPARPNAPAQVPARPRVATPAASYTATPDAEYRTPARTEVKSNTPPASRPAEPQMTSVPAQVVPDAPGTAKFEPTPAPEPVEVKAAIPAMSTPVVEEPVVDESEPVYDAPTLTLSDVKEKWEMIRRRVRTRADGPKIAALLGGYVVLGVEGTSQLPVVVCKANMDFHYKTLQNDNYYDSIRWALKVELKTECNIRLLPPNANVSIPTFPRPGVAPSQPSAQRSRAESPVAPKQSTQPKPSAPEPEMQQTVAARPAPPPPPQATAPAEPVKTSAPPLARSEAVRENTTKTPANNGTHLHSIKQHAESNPVVTEVIRMFKAEIKEIHPK